MSTQIDFGVQVAGGAAVVVVVVGTSFTTTAALIATGTTPASPVFSGILPATTLTPCRAWSGVAGTANAVLEAVRSAVRRQAMLWLAVDRIVIVKSTGRVLDAREQSIRNLMRDEMVAVIKDVG
nr:hypothetical protein B0A51_17492 [Rachicladosporium sp. CCFEE 5018]